jgi:hypothetical protein
MVGAGLFWEKSTADWLRLVAGGWFVLREKYCWLVADKPSEQGVSWTASTPKSKRGYVGQLALLVLLSQSRAPKGPNKYQCVSELIVSSFFKKTICLS